MLFGCLVSIGAIALMRAEKPAVDGGAELNIVAPVRTSLTRVHIRSPEPDELTPQVG